MEEIYSDGAGTLKAKKDEKTGSIILCTKYMDLKPDELTFPNEAIDKLIAFLEKQRD